MAKDNTGHIAMSKEIITLRKQLAEVTEKGEAVTNALGVSMIEVHDLKVDLGEFGGHKAKCKVNYHIKGLPCDCGWDKARKKWLKAP